jgi:hypothetical protein
MARASFAEAKLPMALHHDIYWVGRQWAVTGSGIQACDQKRKAKFDIEASRIWQDGVLESVRALNWLNSDDFEKAVSVARKYYPEPARKAPPPEARVSRLREAGPKASGSKAKVTKASVPQASVPQASVPLELAKEPPKPVVQKFAMRIEGLKAKLIPVWRIRFRGR